jgi:hypothetical protein
MFVARHTASRSRRALFPPRRTLSKPHARVSRVRQHAAVVRGGCVPRSTHPRFAWCAWIRRLTRLCCGFAAGVSSARRHCVAGSTHLCFRPYALRRGLTQVCRASDTTPAWPVRGCVAGSTHLRFAVTRVRFRPTHLCRGLDACVSRARRHCGAGTMHACFFATHRGFGVTQVRFCPTHLRFAKTHVPFSPDTPVSRAETDSSANAGSGLEGGILRPPLRLGVSVVNTSVLVTKTSPPARTALARCAWRHLLTSSRIDFVLAPAMNHLSPST